jgi:hypothetical protein
MSYITPEIMAGSTPNFNHRYQGTWHNTGVSYFDLLLIVKVTETCGHLSGVPDCEKTHFNTCNIDQYVYAPHRDGGACSDRFFHLCVTVCSLAARFYLINCSRYTCTFHFSWG